VDIQYLLRGQTHRQTSAPIIVTCDISVSRQASVKSCHMTDKQVLPNSLYVTKRFYQILCVYTFEASLNMWIVSLTLKMKKIL